MFLLDKRAAKKPAPKPAPQSRPAIGMQQSSQNSFGMSALPSRSLGGFGMPALPPRDNSMFGAKPGSNFFFKKLK